MEEIFLLRAVNSEYEEVINTAAKKDMSKTILTSRSYFLNNTYSISPIKSLSRIKF